MTKLPVSLRDALICNAGGNVALVAAWQSSLWPQVDAALPVILGVAGFALLVLSALFIMEDY